MVNKKIGATRRTESVCRTLLSKLVFLEESFTFDFEIFFPDHHIHGTPGRTCGAIAVADGVFLDGGHGDTKADGFAMTPSCVCCRGGFWVEKVPMHYEWV